jgi:hypothetical protein
MVGEFALVFAKAQHDGDENLSDISTQPKMKKRESETPSSPNNRL